MLKNKSFAPLQLALLYAALSMLWIVVSDVVFLIWTGHSVSHLLVNLGKGAVFVAVSAVILHQLARFMMRRLLEAEQARQSSEHRAAAEVERSRQLYATLARANEVALAATDRQQLTQRICEALVDCAGMRLAWLGWVEEDTQLVRIESCSGPASSYTEGLVISADSGRMESRGPTGQSIIRQRTFSCQNIPTEPLMAPWRDRAARFGFVSSAAVPVRDADGTRGSLTMYSAEENFFTPEIVGLIEQLAADLQHGLEVLAVRRRVEEQNHALRESEERYRSMFENSHAVMLLIDTQDGAIVDANPAAARFYGWPREQLRRMNIGEINTLGPEKTAEEMKLAREQRRTYFHFKHRLADGTERDVEVFSGPVKLGGRALLYSIIHDETDRGRMERALRDSEQRWQYALEGTEQGVWDWNVQTGEVYFSPRIHTMLGHEPGEFTRGLADWEQRVHPDDLPGVRRLLEDYFAGKVADYSCEHRLRCKDGSYKWILDRGMIVARDTDGRPQRMIGTHVDITARKEAERSRRELLEQFTLLANHIPGVIYQFRLRADGSSHFPYSSGGMMHVYGVTPEQVAEDATPVFNILHPEDRERVTATILDSARRLTVWRDSYRVILPDGRLLWLQGESTPQRQEDGSTLWHGYIWDITERRRAEHEYTTLFNSMLEGFAWHEMIYDEAGRPVDYRFLRVNPAFERQTGLRAADIIGRTVREVLPATDQVWIERYGRVASTGEPAFFQHYSEPLNRHYEVTAFRPEPDHFACIFNDITDRQRSLDRLQLLGTALEAVPAGVVITDREGAVEWVNRGFTRLTGYTLDEVVGQNPRILKSGLQDADFYRRMWETIMRGEVWEGELTNRRKDGKDYLEQMIIAPVIPAAGNISHFIAIKQDITERRQLEHQLLHAQRLEGIGLLAGGIAHDLNNVLSPILLSVELLRLRCKDPIDSRTLEVIESSARRGAGVVRQVLTFARGIEGSRTPIRPRDLVRELVLIIEETFPRDITVRREVAPDVPPVIGDATQLHQVLLNFAVNARDAMPQGGTLTFRIAAARVPGHHSAYTGEVKAGDYVMIAVRDTGQGMPAEIRERIFEPFFTTKARGKGTGLGLPTALGIVRSHGGFLELESEPGQGTEFRVFLPAGPVEKEDSHSPFEGPAVQGAGRSILICDDEPVIREVARTILEMHGFKVLEAGNGREALVVFAEHRAEICAVIMDQMMPIMTGVQAAKDLLGQSPDLPMIVISGLMDVREIEELIRTTGAKRVEMLKKPFFEADLLVLLQRLLAKK